MGGTQITEAQNHAACRVIEDRGRRDKLKERRLAPNADYLRSSTLTVRPAVS